jgi:iron complex outermembrane receptor protein
MIQSGRFRLTFLGKFIFALVYTAQVQAQAPAPSPSGTVPGGTEQGSQLQQITVTGYIIPHVRDGPQPVVSYDRDYIQKSGNQTVTDVILNLPSAVGNFATNTTSGFGFSPGAASVSLKGAAAE